MSYLIGVWNIVAVTVFALTVFVLYYLLYICNREESGHWCVEMPDDFSSDPGILAKAFWVGLPMIISVFAFTLLFEWLIGEPAIGGFIAVFILLVYYFPDEIAEFSGEIVCRIGVFIKEVKRAKEVVRCPGCQNELLPKEKQKRPVKLVFIPKAYYIEGPNFGRFYELLESHCGKCEKEGVNLFPLGTATRLGLSFTYATYAEPDPGKKSRFGKISFPFLPCWF